MVEGVEREPRVGAQRQIDVLQFPLLGRENLCGLDRGAAGGDGAGVPMPRRDIPAPRPAVVAVRRRAEPRSEEHTSELQSPCNLVCRLLLEKKKKEQKQTS